MKKGSFRWLLVVMMIFAFAFAAVGCGAFTITITNAGEVMVGQELTLTAQVKKGEDIQTDAVVTWTVADKEGSTCNPTITGGKLKATAAGTVIVTAKYEGAEATKEITIKENAAQNAADKFKADHSVVLGKTVSNITVGDKAAVTAALSAYNALSSEAKALVSTQKTLLDNLSAKITELENEAEITAAVNKFKADHATVLALAADKVVIGDKGAVQAAVTAYGALSTAAKSRLTAEKAHLDALVEAIEAIEAEMAIEEAKQEYLDTYADVLALVAGNITLADEEAILAAVEAYELLSDEVKDRLVDEKAHLDALVDEIEAIKVETAIEEAKQEYLDTYADVLALVASKITLDDEAAILEALEAFELLSGEVKARLANEKAHLDALAVLLDGFKGEEGFLAEFETILKKKLANITLDDLDAVEEALYAYSKLGTEAQEALAAEKALLDSFLNAIDAMQAIVDVADEVDTYLYTYRAVFGYPGVATGKAPATTWVFNTVAQGPTDVVRSLAGINWDTTSATDRALGATITAAIAAYNNLSAAAQRELSNERIVLTLLNTSFTTGITNALNAYNTFTGSVIWANANAVYGNCDLGLPAYATWTAFYTAKTAVNNAIAYLNTFTASAQAAIEARTSARAILEYTLWFLEEQEVEIGLFLADANVVAALNYTVTGTTSANFTARATSINNAITAYGRLFAANREMLAEEKAHLDALRLKLAQLYANNFKNVTAATILANDIEKVQLTDKTAITTALTAYNTLISTTGTNYPDAAQFLTAQKALLDSFLAKIVSIEVASFKDEHFEAISLDVATFAALTGGDLTRATARVTAARTAVRNTAVLHANSRTALAAEAALLNELYAIIESRAFLTTYNASTAILNKTLVYANRIADRGLVNAAITAYGNLLTGEAQMILLPQLLQLNNMLATIDGFDAEKFVTDHAAALALTVDKMTLSNTTVAAARTAYNNLPAAIRYLLVEENAQITLMENARVMLQWLADNAALLAKNLTGTVNLIARNDGAALTTAITAGNRLVLASMVADEIAYLVALLEKADELEAEWFVETQYANVLAFTVDTVTVTDKTAVTGAITQYNTYPSTQTAVNRPGVAALLTESKEYLDELLAKIQALEFVNAHINALALEIDKVTVISKTIVGDAIDAFYAASTSPNYLTPATKAMLESEIALLEALYEEICEQQAEAYRNKYAVVLSLNEEIITLKNEQEHFDALLELNGFAATDIDVYFMLLEELDLLEMLGYQLEALTYEDAYEALLALTVDDIVDDSEEGNIINAIVAYDSLNIRVRRRIPFVVDQLEMLLYKIEAYKFTATHATALASDINDAMANRVIIIAALDDYDNNLSDVAKSFVEDERGLLEVLLNEIAVTEANAFENDSKVIAALKFDLATVVKTNETAIKNAMAVANNYTERTIQLLAYRLGLFEAMLYKISNSVALGYNVATITTSTAIVNNINKAIDAYEITLPTKAWGEEAQMYLLGEKAMLDALADRLVVLANEAEVTKFKANASVKTALTYTVETLAFANKATLENAVKEYFKYSVEIRQMLKAEKELLDALTARMVVLGYENSANLFKSSTAKTALGYKVESIVITSTTQETAINKAIDEYWKLSRHVRTLLTVEKAYLDTLAGQVTSLKNIAEAEKFRKDYKDTLAMDIEKVTYSSTTVNAMYIKYNAYSAAIKALLVEEAATIEALYAKYFAASNVQAAETFKRSNATTLGYTLETVSRLHKTTINTVLTAYDKLTKEVKALLTEELAHLEALLARATQLEDENTVAVFKATTGANAHGAILNTTVEALKYNQNAALTSARNRYSVIIDKNDAVKAMLIDEKAHLDALAARMVVLGYENQAATFKSNKQSLLKLTETTVTTSITTKNNIIKALADLDALADEVQQLLTEEKAHLETLLDKIAELNDTRAVEAFRANAVYDALLNKATPVEADRANILAALAAIDGYSEGAQDQLSYERYILEEHLNVLDRLVIDGLFTTTYTTDYIEYDYATLLADAKVVTNNWAVAGTGLKAKLTALIAAYNNANIDFTKNQKKLLADEYYADEVYFAELEAWIVIVDFELTNVNALVEVSDLETMYAVTGQADYNIAKTAITNAYTAYKALSRFVRGIMMEVTDLEISAKYFEELVANIHRIETEGAIATFYATQEVIDMLSLAVEDVTIGEVAGEADHRTDIAAAIIAYGTASGVNTAIQGLIDKDYLHLIALRDRATLLDTAVQDVDTFINTTYVDIMFFDETTRDNLLGVYFATPANRTGIFTLIDAMLNDMDAFNDETLERLAAAGCDENYIDWLIMSVESLEAAAFVVDYTTILAINLNAATAAVVLAAEADLILALQRYNDIFEGAQGLLASEKAKLDALEEAIQDAKDAQTNAAAFIASFYTGKLVESTTTAAVVFGDAADASLLVTDIKAFLAAYNLLTTWEKQFVAIEKTKADALITAMVTAFLTEYYTTALSTADPAADIDATWVTNNGAAVTAFRTAYNLLYSLVSADALVVAANAQVALIEAAIALLP